MTRLPCHVNQRSMHYTISTMQAALYIYIYILKSLSRGKLCFHMHVFNRCLRALSIHIFRYFLDTQIYIIKFNNTTVIFFFEIQYNSNIFFEIVPPSIKNYSWYKLHQEEQEARHAVLQLHRSNFYLVYEHTIAPR